MALSATLIILLSLSSIILAGVNLKPVKATVIVEITNVDFPDTARPRLPIQGRIDFTYSADEDIEIEFEVQTHNEAS